MANTNNIANRHLIASKHCNANKPCIAKEHCIVNKHNIANKPMDSVPDDKHKRTNGNKTMILMRVLLGEPYINKNGNPPKYQRPPCKSCYQDKCQCKAPSNFDSVIDDAGRNFREFVVYERCMCYPEYFITYQRV